MRRWQPTIPFTVDGNRFRVVPGKKDDRPGGPGSDLRMEQLRSGVWVPVKMELGFLFADFFYDNEDMLYPPRLGYRGGEAYLSHVIGAAHMGWRTAQRNLEASQARSVA